MKTVKRPYANSHGQLDVLATMTRLTMVTGRETATDDPMELIFCDGQKHFYCPLTSAEKTTLIDILKNGQSDMKSHRRSRVSKSDTQVMLNLTEAQSLARHFDDQSSGAEDYANMVSCIKLRNLLTRYAAGNLVNVHDFEAPNRDLAIVVSGIRGALALAQNTLLAQPLRQILTDLGKDTTCF